MASGRLSEEDRTAIVEALKAAYVHDLLDADGLSAAVEQAHRATTLHDLEGLLPSAG